MYEKIKERIIEFILSNKLICFLVAISTLLTIFSISFVYFNKCPKCKKPTPCKSLKIQKNKEEDKSIKVDVKGEVINPGVYTLKNGLTIDDAIKIAGGLKENATTKNINLSKHLEDE